MKNERVPQDGLASLKKKLYAFSFFDEFILIYPFYALMFQDNGLSGAQISSLFIIFSIIIFLLEVPSGAIADRYSRKNVLIAGILARAGAFGMWLLFPNYIGFLLGFILWGIKRAFVSGTLEAFVYDELQRTGKTEIYTKLTGTMQSYNMLGFVLGSLAAALLAGNGYNIILILSIAAVCASAVAIYLLPTAPKVKSTEEVRYFEYLKEGIRLVGQRPILRSIVLFGATVGGLKVVDEYYNLFFKELHFSNTEIAVWVAVIYMLGAVGSSSAHWFEGKRVPAFLGVILWAALLGLAVLLPSAFAPLFIGLFAMLFYAMSVLINSHLQKHTESKTRATTTSVMGFMSGVFTLIVFGIFGATSAHSYSLGLGVIACLILALGALIGFSRVKRQPE
jgi:MFS family permease